MKIYKIKCDIDYEKVAFATLKKVYSPTLYPRILTNCFDEKFLKLFENFAQIDAILPKNAQNFAKNVRIKGYDIGLFFFNKEGYSLKIFDGNGLLAGSFVTNIFDDMFTCSNEHFFKKKKEITTQYKKLKVKKLLIQ